MICTVCRKPFVPCRCGMFPWEHPKYFVVWAAENKIIPFCSAACALVNYELKLHGL